MHPASLRPLRRAWARRRFGDLGRTAPVSQWGTGRGTPVDRYYIERFLRANAEHVRGRVLEVKSDLYATRLGAASVDIVDIDAGNPAATLVGDLCAEGTLPARTYDAAVVTQTLMLLADPATAVRNLLASLRPGGTLLVTAPALARVIDETDRWRWTPAGLGDLLRSAAADDARVEATGLGNGLAARAFLFGLAAEELDAAALAQTDPAYPLIAAGSVRLP